ncbi:hypothetical protein EYF80_027065 [Liparis tanakae]|uniref:Uncharacterized protein n=1 Tax=Liparis tanakae TaxID=230148 RepID=A0A4Z2HCI4_9TELE|nr:hypothetical protein EYF80_027065 [Liparis tanakae]
MNRDARLRRQARLKLLEGLQAEVEHGAERTRVDHRDPGGSAGPNGDDHVIKLRVAALFELFECLLEGHRRQLANQKTANERQVFAINSSRSWEELSVS